MIDKIYLVIDEQNDVFQVSTEEKEAIDYLKHEAEGTDDGGYPWDYIEVDLSRNFIKKMIKKSLKDRTYQNRQEIKGS